MKDWDTFIQKGSTTRYIGDAICLVVSAKEKSLDEIKALIKVKYTPLKPIKSPEEALSANAPIVITSYSIHYTKLYDMVTEVYVQQDGNWKLASLSFTKLLTP